MTRRERRGTMALLAMIALVLAATALFRNCAHVSRVDPQQVEIEQFEQQIDSVKPSTPVSKRPFSAKKRRVSPRKEKKTQPGQRRLEPVPQISVSRGGRVNVLVF